MCMSMWVRVRTYLCLHRHMLTCALERDCTADCGAESRKEGESVRFVCGTSRNDRLAMIDEERTLGRKKEGARTRDKEWERPAVELFALIKFFA